MVATQTLAALALLISNSHGAIDTTAAQAQLTQEEQTQVQTYIQEENELPGTLENLLAQTHVKIQAGELTDALGRGEPTDGCL